MNVCALTDIGRRREMNQDYVFSSEDPVGALPNLFLVADGMGGHNAGEFASRSVVETISNTAAEAKDATIPDILTTCVEQANTVLRKCAEEKEERHGMGTTLVAAVLDDHTLHVANVGDSRLYIVGETIRQVTTDHSLVQEMLDRGEIDKELARIHPDKNIITRAVGAAETVQADLFTEPLERGNLIVMCTDGLTNMLEDGEILRILTAEGNLMERTERLVEQANEHGGKDNITVIVIDPELEG